MILLSFLVLVGWVFSFAALNQLRKRLMLGGAWRFLPALTTAAPVVLTWAVAPFVITQSYVILQWTFVLTFLLSFCAAISLLAFRGGTDAVSPEVFE